MRVRGTHSQNSKQRRGPHAVPSTVSKRRQIAVMSKCQPALGPPSIYVIMGVSGCGKRSGPAHLGPRGRGGDAIVSAATRLFEFACRSMQHHGRAACQGAWLAVLRCRQVPHRSQRCKDAGRDGVDGRGPRVRQHHGWRAQANIDMPPTPHPCLPATLTALHHLGNPQPLAPCTEWHRCAACPRVSSQQAA